MSTCISTDTVNQGQHSIGLDLRGDVDIGSMVMRAVSRSGSTDRPGKN